MDLDKFFRPQRCAVVGVSLSNLLRSFGGNPEVSMIIAFLEGFEPGRGRELLEVVADIGQEKPIVIMKSARTEEGQIAKQYKKAVIAYVPDLAKYGMVLDGFVLNGIPVVHSIQEAVLIVKGLWDRGRTNL